MASLTNLTLAQSDSSGNEATSSSAGSVYSISSAFTNAECDNGIGLSYTFSSQCSVIMSSEFPIANSSNFAPGSNKDITTVYLCAYVSSADSFTKLMRFTKVYTASTGKRTFMDNWYGSRGSFTFNPSVAGTHYLYIVSYAADGSTILSAVKLGDSYYVKSYEPDLYSIYVKTAPTKVDYYKNEYADPSGLQVYAIYKYHLAGTIVSETGTRVYSYSCAFTSSLRCTTVGTNMSVVVKYTAVRNGASFTARAYFYINVYGVKNYEFSYQADNKIGTSLPTPTCEIEYDDGYSETVSCDVGSHNVNYTQSITQSVALTATATKTGETLSETASIRWWAPSSISVGGTYATEYWTGDSYSSTGLVVTRVFSKNSSWNDVLSSSDYSVSGFDSSKPGTVTLTVSRYESYGNGGQNLTTTFSVTVKGLESIRVSTANYDNLFVKGSAVGLSGVKLFWTLTGQEEAELSLDSEYVSVDSSAIDTSSTGTQTITITVSYLGVTKTASVSVVVYALASLDLSGYSTETYSDQYSSGSLKVVANFTDGVASRTLSASEYSIDYPSPLIVGSNTITVSATVGDTASSSYTLVRNEDYPVAITNVDSSSWDGIFAEGETFSSSGIKVYATMKSGAANRSISFYTSIDGQVFGEDITDVSTAFTIHAKSYDDGGNETSIAYGTSLTATYDTITALTVSAGTGRTTYKAGEAFSTSGMTAVVTYAASGNVSLSMSALTHDHGDAFSASEAGSVNVTFSYEGATAVFAVTVVKLSSISVSIASNDRKYDRQEALDESTLTIAKTYTDGSVESLSADDVVFPDGMDCLVPDDSSYYTDNKSVTVSYTEATVTKTATFSLSIRCLSSVELFRDGSAVSKVSFDYGEEFSLVGYTIKANYNNGANTQVVVDSSTAITSVPAVGAYVKNKVSSAYVAYTFGGETKKASFVVHCVYLDRISVDSSAITSATHYYGETLDLSSVTVTAYFKSTDTEVAETSSTVTSSTSFSPVNGSALSAGTYSVSASYTYGSLNTEQTRTASFSFTVLNVVLQGLTLDTSNLLKALDSYVETQRLSVVGLVATANFNRAASDFDVALANLKYYIGTTQVSPTQYVTEEMDGENLVVTYTYDGVTVSATVGTLSVAAKVMTAIRVYSESRHDSAFQIGDEFSSDGLILEAKYNDSDDWQSTLTSGFTTSDDGVTYSVSEVSAARTVTVTYGSLTCTYDVSVTVPALSSLKLDTTLIPLSVTNGTAYSLEGLVVTAVFENGYEETLSTYTSDVVARLNIDGDGLVQCTGDLGTKTVTITGTNPYDNTDVKTATLGISVTPNMELQAIKLVLAEGSDEYVVGDEYDAHGVTVMALFKDASDWIEVSGWETTPVLGSVLRSGGRVEVTVSYTDAGVVKTATYVIVVSVVYENKLTDTDTYRVAFNVADVRHEEMLIEFSDDLLPLFPNGLVQVCEDETSEWYGYNVYTGDDADEDCVGYVDLGAYASDGTTVKNGHVVLFDDPVNPIEGQGNIVVRFPHYVEGYADRINNCRFGIVYNKRLFLSGNESENGKYRNIDWHSGEVNYSQAENYDIDHEGDLTYFPDLNYCRYGSAENKVVGYDIYRDGTLLVFKDGSRGEATIYARSYSLVNASSYDGTTVEDADGNSLAEEAYPCFAVNLQGGDGAISDASIANFNGETVVLTKRGVRAVTSKETTYNNAKYTYDVSTHVNPVLKGEDLSDAVMFAFRDRLFLQTPNRTLVADDNLRSDGSGEYEWFPLDDLGAHAFFVIDDELYFADDSGKLKRFSEETGADYVDREREYIGSGSASLTIDGTNDSIIVSADHADKVAEGKAFHLLSNYSVYTGGVLEEYEIHGCMGSFVNVNNVANAQGLDSIENYVGTIDPDTGYVVVHPLDSEGEFDYDEYVDVRGMFYDGRRVYLDEVEGDSANAKPNVSYYLSEVETNDARSMTFVLLDSTGAQVPLDGVDSFRMSFRVSDLQSATIENVEDYGTSGAKTFGLKGDHGRSIDLIYYNGYNGSYRAVITTESHVDSEFVTKPFDMGTIVANKTIWQWTISNDTELDSYMDVGYLTSRKQGDFVTAVGVDPGATAFTSAARFDRIQFTSDKLPHVYSRYRTVPNVGFIRFLFKNDVEGKMVLSKLSLTYTITLLTKGVK